MASPDPVAAKKKNIHLLTLISVAAFVLMVVWFTLQNAETVRFQFALWGWTISLALLLFTCVFAGIVLACLAVLPAFLGERKFRNRAEHKMEEMSREIEELKKLIQ